MQGFGTYTYPDGSTYCGEWVGDKHHGRGDFTFANGTSYSGEWKEHLMHGKGVYTDHLGRKWEGEFREGVFESREQLRLNQEMAIEARNGRIKQTIKQTIARITEALGKGEGVQTEMLKYFAFRGQLDALVKVPKASFKDRTVEQWQEIFKAVEEGEIKILHHRYESKSIDG